MVEFWASSGYPKFKRWITRNKRAACQFTPAFVKNGGKKSLIKLKDTHVGISKNTDVHIRIRDDIAQILS